MGITGLLKHLGPLATKGAHVSDYADTMVAIDGFVWLHRACHGCAWELQTDMPKAEDRFSRFMMRKVELLKHSHVTPLVVFDGNPLTMKGRTNDKRRADRKKHLDEGNRLTEEAKRYSKNSGKRRGAEDKARASFQKCVSVTPGMVAAVLKVFRQMGVDYVVSPYEADPQLAFECLPGQRASAIITEDSDVLLFCLAAFATWPGEAGKNGGAGGVGGAGGAGGAKPPPTILTKVNGKTERDCIVWFWDTESQAARETDRYREIHADKQIDSKQSYRQKQTGASRQHTDFEYVCHGHEEELTLTLRVALLSKDGRIWKRCVGRRRAVGRSDERHCVT